MHELAGEEDRGVETGLVKIFLGKARLAQDGTLEDIPQHLQLPRPIPILGKVSAGFPSYAREEVIGYTYHSEVPRNAYALVVRGDSMEPTIRDGDHVIFTNNGEYTPGDVLVVLNEWGEATLKRLKEKEGVNYLVPDNNIYPSLAPNEHYKIIGKVVKVVRDVRF
jgi:repressor LexA